MRIEQTTDGWTARLTPTGVGRFFAAGLLGLWLCGWAVGEVVGLGLAFGGLRALARRTPPVAADLPTLLPLLLIGAFVLAWLTLWTIGGVTALGALARLLSSEDRLVASPAGLKVMRRVGPFRRVRTLPRAELVGVDLSVRHEFVEAKTVSGPVELTRLGARAERQAIVAALRRELSLPAPAPQASAEPATPPPGWDVVIDAEGGTALVRDVATRRKQARVMWVLAALTSAGAYWIVAKTVQQIQLAGVAAMACLLAGAGVWGAVWLTCGRHEWRIARGRLTLRRRFRSRARDLFAAGSLQLARSRDSDGDDWWTLSAIAEGAQPGDDWKTRASRRSILRAIHNVSQPRQLGAWLAQAAEIPLHDLTGAESLAAQLARLKADLPRAGLVGRWATRLIERAERQSGR